MEVASADNTQLPTDQHAKTSGNALPEQDTASQGTFIKVLEVSYSLPHVDPTLTFAGAQDNVASP